ncbi:MAG: hypothetical protein FWF03_01775 [Defluviitaleaceae bacterium]|nr:hypothetical protein [Defluviitaleaceae bacterium]
MKNGVTDDCFEAARDLGRMILRSGSAEAFFKSEASFLDGTADEAEVNDLKKEFHAYAERVISVVRAVAYGGFRDDCNAGSCAPSCGRKCEINYQERL